ncbi:MAG: (4Fe-4S)-binding protein [Bacteroidales bacterium]|jgi:uncharacterized Fe-S cluster protein YjdI|nr:(4Fe-4S)-binding protein [Bacteroidales bacterium]
MKKEYSNGEITVSWEPSKCLHAAECVAGAPKVFQPTERPWIKPENADSEYIAEVIERCPSKALTYQWNKK